MIHLLFLLASLGLVIISQKILLLALAKTSDWAVRRGLQLLGLAMPLTVLLIFSLTMLPSILTPEMEHRADQIAHHEWLISLISLSILFVPLILTFWLNLFRLCWLYWRSWRRSWSAPAGLAALALESSYPEIRLEIRLWHSAGLFAFNLPKLLPLSKNMVIISTGMVAQLDLEELRAVLRHEVAHLKAHDFWIIWLAGWWREAFFYLLYGKRFFTLLQQEQELVCDERVALEGGPTLALALADALLKVWEETMGKNHQPRNQQGGLGGLKTPGLAAKQVINLTEQRVTRLIDFDSLEKSQLSGQSGVAKLKTGGMLGSALFLWLGGLVLVHLLMIPLGCAVSLGLI